MGFRSLTIVRIILLGLAAVALGACLGAAEAASAGPDTVSLEATPALGALLVADQQQLTAADGATGEYFGYSVAISGDTAVVGAVAPGGVPYSSNEGVYVFVRSGTAWTVQQKLTASDVPDGEGVRFGCSVAISGDTVAVSAPDADSLGGPVYVFVRSGTAWSEQQKLTAPTDPTGDRFGCCLALSGDTLLVGYQKDDVGANENQGSVYVFVRSGTSWSEQQRLIASDGAAEDYFGYSVGLSDDTAVVGAAQDDVGANENQGSVYVFVRSGTSWSEQQKLTAADGQQWEYFGGSIGICGGTLVVGAPYANVGANVAQGAAYMFARRGTTWSEQQKLTASDGMADDYFAYSVALSSNGAVVGARQDDVDDNEHQGSAYVFARRGPSWTEQQKLTAGDGAAHDAFGWSVALSGSIAVVGAPWDDVDSYTEQGSAYLFNIAKPGKPTPR